MGSGDAVAGRYRSLDLWRGLACLMVVFDHSAVVLHQGMESRAYLDLAAVSWEGWFRWLTAALSSQALGPAMFFVISGLCLASALDSASRKGMSPLTFWTRRLRRTFPPLWIALGFFVAVLGVCDLLGLRHLYHAGQGIRIAPTEELSLAQWVGNLTLTETWRWRCWGDTTAHLHMGVIWTLCHQEQFYLICALILLLFPRNPQRALVVLTCLIAAYRVVIWDIGGARAIEGIFTQYWMAFACGLAVHWSMRLESRRDPEALRMRGAIMAALVALGVVGWIHHLHEELVASCFALTLIGLRRFDKHLTSARWSQPFQALGRRCFSIYLTHLSVCVIVGAGLIEWGLSHYWAMVFVVVPTATLTSLAVGFGFYRLVESRWLNSSFVAEPASAKLVSSKPKCTMALPV